MTKNRPAGDGASLGDLTGLTDTRELYNEVASAYDLADRTPVKESVMGPSVVGALRAALGRDGLVGTTGLDLACGTGFLTRLVARAGARMIGIDLSAQMIAHAERNWHEGIQYRVGDVHMLDVEALRQDSGGGFDFLVAGFLFNYARDPEQIRTLAERALSVLKPGGVGIGLLPNPDLPIIPADSPARVRYGLSATMDLPLVDGARRWVTYWQPDGTEIVTIEHTHWSRGVYTREMSRAGAEVEWRHCQPSPQSGAQEPNGFWQDYEAAPQHDIVILRPTGKGDY